MRRIFRLVVGSSTLWFAGVVSAQSPAVAEGDIAKRVDKVFEKRELDGLAGVRAIGDEDWPNRLQARVWHGGPGPQRDNYAVDGVLCGEHVEAIYGGIDPDAGAAGGSCRWMMMSEVHSEVTGFRVSNYDSAPDLPHERAAGSAGIPAVVSGMAYSLDLITDDDVMSVITMQKELNFKPGDKHVILQHRLYADGHYREAGERDVFPEVHQQEYF